MVVIKPGFAQNARPLGVGDVIVLDGDIDVVAHAPAEGADGVLDYGEFHDCPGE